MSADVLFSKVTQTLGALWLEAALGEIGATDALAACVDIVKRDLGVGCAIEESTTADVGGATRFPFRGATAPCMLVFDRAVPLHVGSRIAAVAGRLARLENTRSARQLRHDVLNSLAVVIANVEYAEQLVQANAAAIADPDRTALQRSISASSEAAHELITQVTLLTEAGSRAT